MKKFTALILIFSLIFVFVGCADDAETVRPGKKEIVVACGKDDTGTLETVMQEFTSKSENTQVKLLEFSNESVELHRIISSMLAGQEVKLDAVLIEDVWVGEFIKDGRLLSLGSAGSVEKNMFPKGMEAFVGRGDTLYWYPIMLDIGLMYCREGLTDGDATLQELAGGQKGAYALHGTDGEEMLCCALEFVRLAGSVDGGLELYKRANKNADGSSDDYLMDFKDGKASYVRSWASNSKELVNSYLPAVGSVGAELLKKDDSTYATARAYGFSINYATENADGCFELLEYLKSDAVQKQLVKGTGTLPLKLKYYDDPMIIDSYDYIASGGEQFNSFNFRPAREDYTHASREAQMALGRYLKDDAAYADAVSAVESLINIK